MSEDMKKIIAFLESDDYKTAQKLAEKSIKEMVEMQNKAEKWDKLIAEDPDATIILGDQLMAACEELDELRTKIEAINTILEKYLLVNNSIIIERIFEVLEPSLDNQEKRS